MTARLILLVGLLSPAIAFAAGDPPAARTWKGVKAEVKAKAKSLLVPTVVATRTKEGKRYFGDPESPSPSGNFNFRETQQLVASRRGFEVRSRILVQVYNRGEYTPMDPPVTSRRARIGWGIPFLSRRVTEAEWGRALGAAPTRPGPIGRLTLRVGQRLSGEPTHYMAGNGMMYKPETWNATQRARFLADHPGYDALGVDPTWGHDF